MIATQALPAPPVPSPGKGKDRSQEVMEKIRELNRNASLIAAHGLYQLVEDTVCELQVSSDLDTKLKGINTLRAMAMDVEKVEAQKATATAASAFFNVILDINAKQVAPPKDPERVQRVDPALVEDAVEVALTPEPLSDPPASQEKAENDPFAALDDLVNEITQGLVPPDAPLPAQETHDAPWSEDLS